MSDLKAAILDARYIDMISLGDFVVQDCGIPPVDSDGNLMPQATEIAAAVFRWAADMKAAEQRATAGEDGQEPAAAAPQAQDEYDEHGDPIVDAGSVRQEGMS